MPATVVPLAHAAVFLARQGVAVPRMALRMTTSLHMAGFTVPGLAVPGTLKRANVYDPAHLPFNSISTKDERELVVVDHVVLDAGGAEIAHTGGQVAVAHRAAGLGECERTCGQRHHHIVVRVPVPARRLARGEPPLGEADALIVELDGGRGERTRDPYASSSVPAARDRTIGIPRHNRFVDGFPTTVTGKVQKFVLRAETAAELGLAEEKTA